jgi:hypothetical protein
MTQMPALIASLMVEGVLGLTSRDRWQAMQQHSDTSVMNSKWFTILMVALLLGSVIALVAVSLVKKYKEMKRRRTEDLASSRATPGKQRTQDGLKAVNTKVVNIAKQVASLIASAGLSRQEVMQLAELIKKEDEKQRTEGGRKLVEEKVGAR